MFLHIPFFPGLSGTQEHFESLPDGHQGTIRTLEFMRWLARRDYNSPVVSVCINDLLQGSPGPAPVETLFLFARDCIKFKEDSGPNGEDDIERIADFQRTTERLWGDCDDKCVWLATALLNQGVACRFRVQSYTGETWDHVYLDFWSWDRWRWVALDPTADGHSGLIALVGWRQPIPINGEEMIFPV